MIGWLCHSVSVAIFTCWARKRQMDQRYGRIATILVGGCSWRRVGSPGGMEARNAPPQFRARMTGEANFWSHRPGITGLELGASWRERSATPSRTIPRAAWISGLAVCAFYVGGTLAVLALMSSGRWTLSRAVMQAARPRDTIGLAGFPLLIALLILAASPARSVPG